MTNASALSRALALAALLVLAAPVHSRTLQQVCARQIQGFPPAERGWGCREPVLGAQTARPLAPSYPNTASSSLLPQLNCRAGRLRALVRAGGHRVARRRGLHRGARRRQHRLRLLHMRRWRL